MKAWNAQPRGMLALGPLVTNGTGWAASNIQAVRADGLVTITFYIRRTGATITAPATGNVANEALVTGIPAYVLPGWDIGWAGPIAGSYGAFGLLQTSGTLLLTATTPNAVIDSGSSNYVTASISYPRA